ncbi:hypothetical protein [Paraburkholderia sp.]|uniref:O-linked N-acetylglucosamine transferase family protein n=1 Tax=Paraburkholderia sp. TaxID=1926495 RepID=UPI003D6ED226
MNDRHTEPMQMGAGLQTYLEERAQNTYPGSRLADLGRHVAQMPRKEQILVWILRDLMRGRDIDSLDALSKDIVAEGLPDDPDLLFVLARAYEQLERFEDGLVCLDKAIAARPDDATYHNNAGVFYDRLFRPSEAKTAFAHAMKLDPECTVYAINYGNICANAFDDMKEAQRAYHLAFAINPEQPEPLMRSSLALLRSGERDKAIDKLKLLLRVHPENVEAIFAKPVFTLSDSYESTDAMLRQRESLVRELDTVHEEVSKVIANPQYPEQGRPDDGWRTLFLLAYQGQNDKAIMQRYSHEMSRVLQIFFSKEIGRSPVDVARPTAGRKIRIGFCTAFFYHHSVWKIPLHGIYTHIDRSRFEVHSFHMGGTVDSRTEEIKELSDSYVRCTTLSSMVERLNNAELDVLIFPELGMDNETFLLSQMRFCAVQCQMLGHPTTSGSRNVDFVLSSDLMEPQDGQEHYTEKLVRLPGLGVTYTYSYEKVTASKSEFGLAEDDVVFFSPQSVFKYLPENDDLFARIALKVDKAKFVFISSNDKGSTPHRIFRKRLVDSFAQHGLDADDHLVFLGPQNKDGFMKASNMADLFIDNPSWSGHNTTLDALHSHTRVVTLRGDMMRKNHSAAILDHLGLTGYIAESKDAFIEKCIQVVGDREDKARFESVIEERLARFSDVSPVRAMEECLVDLTAS